MNNIKEINDFLETNFSYGIVVRGDIDNIKKLKKYLSEQDLQLIYQRLSADKLFILQEHPSGAKYEGCKEDR